MTDLLAQALQSNRTLNMHNEIMLVINIQSLPVGGVKSNNRAVKNEIGFLRNLRCTVDASARLSADGYCLVAALMVGAKSCANRKAKKLKIECDRVLSLAGLTPGPMGIAQLNLLVDTDPLKSFCVALFDYRGIRLYYKDRWALFLFAIYYQYRIILI